MRPSQQEPHDEALGGEEEEGMEEIPLGSLQPCLPRRAPTPGADEAPGVWARVLAMAAGYFSLGMNYYARWRRPQALQNRSSPNPSSHPLGSCLSSSACHRATSEYVGCVHILAGDQPVERLQTELFLMESPLTTRSQLRLATWSPRLPLATTIQFGNRLGLLRLSSPRTCSCRENGTH